MSTLSAQSAKRRKGDALDRFLIAFNKFSSSGANQDKGLKVMQWSLSLLSSFSTTTTTPHYYNKLSNEISMARYLLRFFGLPGALQALRQGTWDDRRTSSIMGKITGRIMALSMLGFYPLEHLSYLGWTSPDALPISLRRQANRFSAYSCRCWLVYLVAEMTQSYYALQHLYRSKERVLKENGNHEEVRSKVMAWLTRIHPGAHT